MITHVIVPVDAERWQNIKQAIQARMGLIITTDKSAEPMNYRGVKLEWSFSGSSLRVTIDSVSFLDKLAGQNESTVMAEIATAIDEVK